MLEFITNNIATILVTIGGILAWFFERKKNQASLIKMEGENTDSIIRRLGEDNKLLTAENHRIRQEYDAKCEEYERAEEANELLLKEVHEMKIKVAELTNQIIRLEAKFRINNSRVN